MADTGPAADALKLVETAIVGIATGKGLSLSPAQIGQFTTDCAEWIANYVTNGVKAQAQAAGDAAAAPITTLEQAETAQGKL